ncbi:MAG: DUF2442 domain-containing protein [Caldilineaceae bacterium]|nr:DUF2442 domain-containing protein [Caldilineaceae bacterium]
MIVNLHFHADTHIVTLSDGSEEVRAPLSWHPRLRHGTEAERANWRLIGKGVGVHWPDLDEDIGVEGLVLGKRSRESEASLAEWVQSRGSC